MFLGGNSAFVDLHKAVSAVELEPETLPVVEQKEGVSGFDVGFAFCRAFPLQTAPQFVA